MSCFHGLLRYNRKPGEQWNIYRIGGFGSRFIRHPRVDFTFYIFRHCNFRRGTTRRPLLDTNCSAGFPPKESKFLPPWNPLMVVNLRIYFSRIPAKTHQIRLIALRIAMVVASIVSVETPCPRYVSPLWSTRTVTSPCASSPTVTLCAVNSLTEVFVWPALF